jgi:ribosome modulation factor
MFAGPDRTPAVDRARAEGKRAGMNGESMKPPYDTTLPQHDQWVEGWHEGQKAIFAIQRKDDGALFDQQVANAEREAETLTAEPIPEPV